ncbi:vacuolar protein sorting-associated protein 35 [Schizophyllum amplum]|uniref:Vacuolar protein sorting-associated protein 35 n=1 Tax=Schizophyllum amplum TaxID=97359 RepID=A0A550CDY2_9AGAR|nr:vacuolar protein sorting-associated protein 35 [Auriculariopsis ampla]
MAIPNVEEGKLLSEALNTVKIQVQQMKRNLELDQLMDALKSASTMLAELRTSSLSPKQYYELYMAVFDALRHLSNYLFEAHTQGKHHLADLYELVQYAGNIIPRLYLMITVGSVYMSIPDAPIREIMKDMMEMSRGVLHPIRGLFLRHYLSGQTRDHLPVALEPGPTGSLQDSISFVLTNFIEMNKLWVRLQHQGHSRDREKREMERRELRILQLDGVDLETYQRVILPSILEQVVSCKDIIAQEYLMEVVIQLHPKVNIKNIVISLIDRLAAYAAREAENEDPEETKRQEEAAAKRLAEKVQAQKAKADAWGETPTSPTTEEDSTVADPSEKPASPTTPAPNGTSVSEFKSPEPKGKGKEGTPVRKFRGVPEDVQLFEVFWQQVVQLIRARSDFCYPDRLEYVDQVLGYAAEKIKEYSDSPDLHAPQTTSNLAALLIAPINSYQSVLTLLAIPNYVPMLGGQLFSTRRSIAQSIISSVLKNETVVETPEDVDGVLELCHVLIKDQSDVAAAAQVNGATRDLRRQGTYSVEREEMAEEQGWIARMVHLFRSENLDTQFELCRRYKLREHVEEGWEDKVNSIFKFLRQLTSILATSGDAPAIALRLFLLAAQVSDECGFEDLTYDLYVQAFTVYEESINESRAQLQAITLIIGTLANARVFGMDNYDTLITKAALHGAKLLKKTHQATAVGLASHLWWQELPVAPVADADGEAEPTEEVPEKKEPVKEEGGENTAKAYPHQDSKRVLECLQKTLRIAKSAIEEIIKVQMECDSLDQYVYYLDRGAPAVQPKFVSNLVELITSDIDGISDAHPSQRPPPGLLEGVQTPEMIARHFKNTLYHIQRRKNAVAEGEGGADPRWAEVDVVGAMLKMGIGRS